MIFLLSLLPLFGYFSLSFLEVEGIGVEFVDIEVMFFSKEAIDSNFKKVDGFLPILFEVGA